jgi:hypothetical protein
VTPTPSNDPPKNASAAAFAEVANAYAARRAELAAVLQGLSERSGRVSALRGVTFLAAVISGGYAIWRSATPAVIAVAAVATVSFLALVILHAVLITRESAVEQRMGIVDRAIARLTWRSRGSAAGRGQEKEKEKAAPVRAHKAAGRPARPAPPDHPYAKDLDVFGEGSLFDLLDTTQTEPGEATLARWLAEPSTPAALAERQEAVRELATLHRFRENLAVEGLRADTKGRAVEPLMAWAEAPPVLAGAEGQGGAAGAGSKRALVIAAAVLVALTVILFTLDQSFGAAVLGSFRRAWLVTVGLQLAVLVALRPAIEPLLATASSRQAPFGRYRSLFDTIERQRFSAPRLTALRDTIRGESGADASAAMRSLEGIIGYADLRHNGLLYILVNVSLLWDVWCAVALDRWRARAGRRARAWFAALGELEAITSLATYTYERPDHTFPEVAEGPPLFAAKSLGHPMIPPDIRVSNDVTLPVARAGEAAASADAGAADDTKGSALLVTGSNMSGKSTLLRAMGINAVLAQAGAPVCAERLRVSPLAVRTSMRIDDSLEQGVSHFYAEVARLKSVVDSADAGEPVLFLLDEILHGTNSRERHIGAKAVVLHLLDRGSIGAVSSHDLALADLAEASFGRIKNVHFEEIIREGRMAFDYVLKPGVVTTTNALRLMRLVGLNVQGLDETAAEQGESAPHGEAGRAPVEPAQ